jgi:hypothetical protein
LGIPDTVRSPLTTTGKVFAHRERNCCNIAAKLRVQNVPYKSMKRHSTVSYSLPLLLAAAAAAQRPGAQVPAGQLSPSEITLSIAQTAKSPRFRRVSCVPCWVRWQVFAN